MQQGFQKQSKQSIKSSKLGDLKLASLKALKSLWNSTPILLGVVLLISIVRAFLPAKAFMTVFGKNKVLDVFIGDLVGSVFAGNPVTSYVLGGELLKQGVSLLAVTAFLVAWVTVGVVQLPAESMLLGKKFAIVRNLTAFVMAIIVALITVLLLSIMQSV
ncbi:permease [Candidatus Woesearchaeota archaeon]|nr:permease [Candidatus Woesearchaeota archaeon]